MSTTVTIEAPAVALSPDLDERINTILAQTDWDQYSEEVSAAVKREVEAYESARARSLASASRKFLR